MWKLLAFCKSGGGELFWVINFGMCVRFFSLYVSTPRSRPPSHNLINPKPPLDSLRYTRFLCITPLSSLSVSCECLLLYSVIFAHPSRIVRPCSIVEPWGKIAITFCCISQISDFLITPHRRVKDSWFVPEFSIRGLFAVNSCYGCVSALTPVTELPLHQSMHLTLASFIVSRLSVAIWNRSPSLFEAAKPHSRLTMSNHNDYSSAQSDCNAMYLA